MKIWSFINQKVSTKIIIGYLFVLILMLWFGLNAIGQLDKINATVSNLTQRLEADKTFAHNIATYFAIARHEAHNFTHQPDQTTFDLYSENITTLKNLLIQINQDVTDPQYQQDFISIQMDVAAYDHVFNQTASLTVHIQETESQVLNFYALIFENNLTALRVYINSLSDPRAFLAFGNIQSAYDTMRINTLKYLSNTDERYTILITRNFNDAKTALLDLEKTLKEPNLNIDAAQSALDGYAKGIKDIQEDVKKLRNLTTEKLDVLDSTISSASSALISKIEARFEEQNQISQNLVIQTRLTLVLTTLAVIVVSLVLGITISYRITKPLRQVMETSKLIANTDLANLTDQINRLTRGDIRLDLDIAARPLHIPLTDEVGQMAQAFDEIIFRLHDAEKAFDQMASYLNEMADAALAVAQGNLNIEIVARSDQDVLANALSTMVSNLREAREGLLSQMTRLATLRQIDSMITTSRDLTRTLNFLLEQTISLLSFSAGEILSYDLQSDEFHSLVRFMVPESITSEMQNGLIKRCLPDIAFRDKSVNLNDLNQYYQLETPLPFDYGIAIPLRVQNECRGLMLIYSAHPMLDGVESDFLDTLSGQAAIAIDNSELVRGLEDRVVQRTLELQKSQKYFEALVNHNPVAILVQNLDGTIASWNPAAEKLFGYKAEEVLGLNLDGVVASKKYLPEASAITKQTHHISEGNVFHTTARRVRRDGSEIDVAISGVPIIVEGNRLGVLAIYYDITELQRARQAAEEATLIKSEFLANMSHEIRTPMNGVVGMTSLLLDTPLSPTQHSYVETIRVSAESLLTIINEILDFSKIEAGRMELDHQPFDLRLCIESALDLVAHHATSKHLELGYLMALGVPEFIFGDVTRLRQILVNLLSNAVKFTDQGEVVVNIYSTSHFSDDRDQTTKTTLLHFSVRDTGLGIPLDRINRLFQSFSQIDSSTTRKYGGTGLGLAISKRLTEMMGGKIWVESSGVPGEGSTFHFTIQASIAPELARQNADVLSAFSGKSVFIVDDNATNREILMRMFETWHFQSLAFSNGPDLLDHLQTGASADLAVVDMQMPGMDGTTLAHECRRFSQMQNTPLIILTSMDRSASDFDTTEIAAFLQKPIKSSQLFDAMTTLFANRPTPVEPSSTIKRYDEHMAEMHPLRILLAEDHAVNQRVAMLLLQRLGYTADIASDGMEVLQALKRQPYDVILMDIQMPEMDGIAATKEIRTRFPAENQPYIIAVTANALQGDRERYLESGMDDYLSKPIRIEDLIKELAKASPSSWVMVEDIHIQRVAATGQPSRPAPVAPVSQDLPPSPIDKQLLNDYIPDYENDLPMLSSIVEIFFHDTPPKLDQLHQGIANGDTTLIWNVAHALKGASLYLGAARLSSLCRELEQAGRNDLKDRLPGLLEEIEKEYQRVQSTLRSLVSSQN